MKKISLLFLIIICILGCSKKEEAEMLPKIPKIADVSFSKTSYFDEYQDSILQIVVRVSVKEGISDYSTFSENTMSSEKLVWLDGVNVFFFTTPTRWNKNTFIDWGDELVISIDYLGSTYEIGRTQVIIDN